MALSMYSTYLWICTLSFQYGFSISALNSLFSAINCGSTTEPGDGLLPVCFNMSVYRFGLLSSIYTVGGLVGSLCAGYLADTKGRKAACHYGAMFVGAGALLMTLSPTYALLVTGRAIVGLGCGIATVIVPTFLSEVAPPEKKGSIGVLNQLGIVIGIFVGQASSLALASSSTWRYVMAISALIAGWQLLTTFTAPESPVWLQRSKAAEESAGPPAATSQDEERPLLEGQGTGALENGSVSTAPPTTIFGVLRSPITRKGVRIVIVTQIFQQASGVNAVLYYSTDIMKNALPTKAGYIALLITAINLLMTFPPIYLIERVGRRPLLLISSASMCVSALLLSLSIVSVPVLASISIVLFVSAFSIGLGPIPFVIIPEVVPPASAAATGSMGLAINWMVNFTVGMSFPPLQQALGPQGVFVLFAAIAAVGTILMAVVYRQ